MLFLILVALQQTINDRASTQYEIAEDGEIAGLDPLIFVRVFFSSHCSLTQSSHQADLQEEDNAVNLQEAIEVPEAGAQPRVRRPSLTSLIVVRWFALLGLILLTAIYCVG